MSNVREILARSELFSQLEDASLDRIASQLKRIVFEKGGIICREGDSGLSMYMIVAGKVSVQKRTSWGQRELQQMGANESFGEMALISFEARSATVRALERTECLQLEQEAFSSLLDQDAPFAQRVAKLLTQRISALDRKTTDELLAAYKALMFGFGALTDSRDPETGAHLERTRGYCVLLSEKLAAHPRYQSVVSPDFIDEMYSLSPLHDIGKVAVPDAILLKPDRLTEEEFEVMKTHTTAGAAAFQKVVEQSKAEVFVMAQRICLHHHEKWDGSGYPAHLAGEAIPIEARIMAHGRCVRRHALPASIQSSYVLCCYRRRVSSDRRNLLRSGHDGDHVGKHTSVQRYPHALQGWVDIRTLS
jgi:HD-GYP domain-containing protein (c-di-GMP phosphodiesterase class II)